MTSIPIIRLSSYSAVCHNLNDGCDVGNIDCAVVVPERSHYREIIEIICQYHLRRTLSLNEGDDIDLKVEI